MGLECVFWLFIILLAPLQAQIWSPLLTFAAAFVKLLHLFPLQSKRWSTRWKGCHENRIITRCTQLLNSPWTFGLALRKMLTIKTTNLNLFFFPHLFSHALAWTSCTAQLPLPIWILQLQKDESDHRNPTLLSSGRGWNWIPAWGQCSWRLITSLQRSSPHPDSPYHFLFLLNLLYFTCSNHSLLGSASTNQERTPKGNLK